MTTILPEYRRRRGVPRALLMLLLGCIALALLSFFSTPLSGLVHRVLFPVYGAESSSTSFFGRLLTHWRSQSDLIAENELLKKENTQSQLLVLDRNRLYEENIALKERLNREADPNAVLATVVVRPPFTPYDTLLIDVGSAEGIVRGDLVAASGSLLIGEVRDVYLHSARVVLFSAPGESHEGFLDTGENGRREPVTIEGLGAGALRARVPRGILVLEGSSVSIPSISANLAATVESVSSSDTDSFQTLYLHLPANYFELERVDVWRNSPPAL